MEKADAIVAGHICLDIFPEIADAHIAFAPGRLEEIGPALLSTGGPVSNTGMTLHKLGINTRLMGKVGADIFGQAIKHLISARDPQLTAGMIEVAGEISSYSIILSTPDSDRMFLHCCGANSTFSAQDVDYALLEAARIFHFGYPPLMRRTIENDGVELAEILKRAKQTGITTSLDMCMPDPKGYSGTVAWRKILERALPYVDLYLPSLPETLFMMDPALLQELLRNGGDIVKVCPPERLRFIAASLMDMGPAIVGLKLGSLGLYLRTADADAFNNIGRACPPAREPWTNKELWSPCFETIVAGTTGSGDATIAGFLAAFLRGCPPERCLTLACAVGACSVEAADATSGVRTWEDTEQRIARGWPRKELPAGIIGWQRCECSGVWSGDIDSSRRKV